MDKPFKILICDDHIAVHESIRAYLSAEGIESSSAYDGQEALQMLEEEAYSLIVLDVMMPKLSGTEVCRQMRKISDLPILMLSANSEEIDRIIGLELGADDYVTKPFSPREVVIRIKKLLKRQGANQTAQGANQTEKPHESDLELLQIGRVILNKSAYTLRLDQHFIDITPKEFDLIYYFASHPQMVLSRSQILNQVWGYDYFGDTRAVDTLIKRLRQKLEAFPTGIHIKAIYGLGYKLEVKP